MTKQLKIVIGVLSALVLFVSASFVFKSDKKDDDFVSFENEVKDEGFSYEDLMESQKGNSFEIDNNIEYSNYEEQKEEQPITEDDIYGNENSELALEMQRKILEAEAERIKKASLQQQSNQNYGSQKYVNQTTSNIPIKKELSKEEKYLQYLERLEKEQENVNPNVNVGQNKKNKGRLVLNATIYDDQYVLPGDRLDLVLSKDAVVRGKKFTRGTPIYAYISISENRVLLEIKNIQGHILPIKAHDPEDYLEGLYSTRAGELWKEFKQSQKDKANKEAEESVIKKTKSQILGAAINDLAGFFKKLRLKKERKILLANDHKVLLYIE